MHRLRVAFAPYWQSIQHALFPPLERVLGPLTEKQQQLVQALEVIRIEQMIPRRFRVPGRPPNTSVPHFQDHASDNWEPEGAGSDGVVNRSWSGRRSNMLSWSTCSIW